VLERKLLEKRKPTYQRRALSVAGLRSNGKYFLIKESF
jgi:hypothetical protein